MANKKEISVQINIGANLEDVQKRLIGLQNKLDKLSLPASVRNEFLGLFSAMDRELEKISQKTAGGKLKLVDSASVGKSIEKIDSLYSALIQKFESRGIATAALKQDQNAISAITSALKVYADSTKSILAEEKKLTAEVQKQERAKEALLEKQKEQKVVSDAELAAQKERVSAATKEANAKAKAVTAARQALEEKIAKSGGTYKLSDIDEKGAPLRKTKAYKEYKAATEASGAANKIKKSEADKFASMTTFEQQKKDIQEVELRITKAKDKLQEFNNTQKATKEIEAFEEVKRQLAELENIDLSKYGIDLAEIKNIEQLEGALEKVKIAAQNSAEAFGKEYTQEMRDAGASTNRLEKDVKDATDAVEDLDERTGQINAMQERVKSFLGISGAAQAMRSALRDAMQTITELDATMTEMAVVTDLSVGDYWNQLPQYSKQASDLGVSINSAYKAATLYYQQGLKSNEVTKISAETLKMARIAGLSAEDATNKMTAALRGFNMELNETSAQRVSDVYSELAAITASDVDEISSAMTKTASIASSAGMEFETTAAFLSQIIETTRESAETAGTALKTVIARFQELKKAPGEIGEVDGEIVDANKIETALRSVGVALRDSSGQFRDLDDVFLELSQKWNTLDTNTQRYIATIAAGSRQQSRFIAMMSDYGRTQQLVTAANNSAGASNKQFEKTLDSLESKLAKLENAWHEFTMGILESELVKTGVDILTKFLEIVNKGTNAFEGLAGSLTKIFSVLSIFKLGMKVFNKFKDPIFNLFGEITNEAGKNGYNSAKKWHEGAKEYWREQNQPTEKKTAEDINSQPKQTGLGIGGWRAFKSAGEAKKQRDQARIDMNAAKRVMAQQGPSKEEYLSAKASLEEIDKNYTFSDKNGLAYKKGEKGAQSNAATNAIKKNQEELNKTVKKYEEIEAASDSYHKAEESYAVASKKQWQSITSGIGAAADATAAVGMGLSMLGGLLSNLGFEEWGEAIAMIGSGLTIAGSIVSILIPLVSALGTATWTALAPILPIILAIAAALLLLAQSIYLVWKASPQAVLQEAEKAAKAAGEAAQEAADNYNNLASAFDSLSGKYKSLKELTKGTKDWNQAVQDINDSVLELIADYPELAGLVESKGGVLTIDIEGKKAQEILRKAESRKITTKNEENLLNIKQTRAENEIKRSKLSNEAQIQIANPDAEAAGWAAGAGATLAGAATGAGIGALVSLAAGPFAWMVAPITSAVGAGVGAIVGAIGGAFAGAAARDEVRAEDDKKEREQTDALAQALAAGEITPDKEGDYKVGISTFLQEKFDYAAEEADKMAVALAENNSELIEYGQALNEAEQRQQAAYDAIAASAWQLADTLGWTEEKIEQSSNLVTGDVSEAFYEEKVKQLESWGEIKNLDDSKKEQVSAAIEEKYGEGAKIDFATGKVTYQKDGEDKTVTLTADQIKTMIATQYATSETSKAIKNSQFAIDTVGETVGKEAIANLYGAEESGALTKNNISTLQEALGGLKATDWLDLTDSQKLEYKNDINKLPPKIQEAWTALGERGQLAYGKDITVFVDQLAKGIALGDEKFLESDNLLAGIQDKNGNKASFSNVNADTAVNLATIVNKVSKENGNTTAGELFNYLEGITTNNTISQEDKNKFTSAFGGLVEGEGYVNREQWEQIIPTLEAMGVKITEEMRLAVQTGMEGVDSRYSEDYLKGMGVSEELIGHYQKAQGGELKDFHNTFAKWKKDYDTANDKGEKTRNDLIRKTIDAIIDGYEKQIDAQEELYNAINEANEKMLSLLSAKIEEDRQSRENDETEQDLNDKRNKLAYLAQDTSGANALEILNLQKEIDEAEQAYQDSLIEQSLQKLEDANAKAAEQRERQIELAREQLEAYSKSEALIGAAKTIVDDAVKKLATGEGLEKTELGKLLAPKTPVTEYEDSVFWSELYSQVSNAIDEENPEDPPETEPKLVPVGGGGGGLGKAAIVSIIKTDDGLGPHFATGGLADFTGPAWLDGTKSRPEYVLNAAQTERFFSLVDVLDSLDTNKVATDKQSGGDNHFDIEINVEKLENDYDVEQLVNKIRSMIYEDATYRNVNAVGMIR